MKYKYIVFDGTIRAEEREVLSVKYDEVLGKLQSIYIGFLEFLVINGLVPVNFPRILGAYAVLRVLEDRGSKPNYSGKLVITNPHGEKGVLGIDLDGVLRTYTGIPRSYIYGEIIDKNPYSALIPLVDHCIYLAEKAQGSTLILGCNIYSLTTLYAYRYVHNTDPQLYCPNSSIFRKVKFKPLRNLSELNTSYDTIIVTSPKYSIVYEVLERVRLKQLIVSKYMFHKFIPLISLEDFNLIHTWRTSQNTVIREKVLKLLKKLIRVVEVDDVEKIISYLHRVGLGVIVKLSN